MFWLANPLTLTFHQSYDPILLSTLPLANHRTLCKITLVLKTVGIKIIPAEEQIVNQIISYRLISCTPLKAGFIVCRGEVTSPKKEFMPSQQNIDQVTAIVDKLAKSQSLLIADYSGLNSAEQTELRAKAKNAGGEFAVSKNRLVAIALKNKLGEAPESLQKALEGPNAAIYGFTDAAAITKVLVDFTRDHENLKIKVGLLMAAENSPAQVLTLAQVKALAALPGRQELLAQLVGQLNAPIYGFVSVLSGTTRKLVYALAAIRDQKSKN